MGAVNQARQVEKFKDKSARVAVVGLGYVGLPLAVAMAEAGYRVTGIDLAEQKVAMINRGESYIGDVPSERLAPLVRQTAEGRAPKGSAAVSASATDAPPTTGRQPSSNNRPPTANGGWLSATSDYSVLAECDAVSICLPTPLNKTGDPDISYIVSAGEAIARHLHPGMLVILESTTYPGTTREVLLPILEGKVGDQESGAKPFGKLQEPSSPSPASNPPSLLPGRDFFLAFSPERVDPGRTDWTVRNTPKVIGGTTPACLAMIKAFYGEIFETLVPVSSPETAEMVKLFENTFRSVNIGLVNELLLMCDKLGLNAWEVLDAADTKPFGFMKFTPGPGLGGHCIPIDPHYLSWKLKTVKYNARFIELASEVNTEMPRYWVQKVQDALNDRQKPVKGSNILVLGVAYKRNVGDVRESPAIDIIRLLQEKGGDVQYHDPFVPDLHEEEIDLVSVADWENALSAADCVIIVTDHTTYDWNVVREQADLIVDTRHVLGAG